MMTKNEKMTCKVTGVIGLIGLLIIPAGYYTGAEARKSIDGSLLRTQSQAIYDLNLELEKSKLIKTKVPIGQKDFACLALNAFNEAGNYMDQNSTKADMFFITSTVFNRAKEYGKTLCDIVYEKQNGVAQYSWTVFDNFPKKELDAKKMNPEKWAKATQIAQALLSGSVSPISNIMWYNNPKASENSYHINKFKRNEFSVYTSIGGIQKDGTLAQHAYYYETKHKNKEAIAFVVSKIGDVKHD